MIDAAPSTNGIFKRPLPHVPFPVDRLPTRMAEYVSAASDAIGCDPAYVALPLLGVAARAVGNRRVIRLKESWHEPCIFWAAIIGKSGTHKSPALSAATGFLHEREAEGQDAYDEALLRHEEELAIYQRDFAAWKKAKTSEPPPWEPEAPVRERYITTDSTLEALVDRLSNQFDGILLCRDELAGWLGSFDQYKQSSSRSSSDLCHWLSFWQAARVTFDRKTGDRKTINVRRAAVSVVGGLQPGVFARAIGADNRENGLCARLLLAMPATRPVKWTEAAISRQQHQAMADCFKRLFELEAAADPDGNPMPYPIGLGSHAKELWIAFFNRHRGEIDDLPDDLAAAWSKLEAYCARFALLNQLMAYAAGEGPEEPIDERSMHDAIALADWFGHEAKRVYRLFSESDETRQARETLELIERRGGDVSPRDLLRAHAAETSEEAEQLLDRLSRLGLGQWYVAPSATKQARRFKLHNDSLRQ